MFCSHCGQQNADGVAYCSSCGQPLTVSTPSVAAAPEPVTDGKAVASLVLGVLSLTFFSIFAGIPAVILGHISRSKIQKSLGRLKGEGIALAGLIMGYISFAAIPVILIIAAIAIPNLLRSRTAANEAGAVGSIRTINTAVITYAAMHPQVGFPENLQDMVQGSGSDALLDRSYAEPTRHGYRFEYRVSSPQGQPAERYFVLATPANYGSTGTRSFCSDESGVIRYTTENEPCTSNSPPLR